MAQLGDHLLTTCSSPIEMASKRIDALPNPKSTGYLDTSHWASLFGAAETIRRRHDVHTHVRIVSWRSMVVAIIGRNMLERPDCRILRMTDGCIPLFLGSLAWYGGWGIAWFWGLRHDAKPQPGMTKQIARRTSTGAQDSSRRRSLGHLQSPGAIVATSPLFAAY